MTGSRVVTTARPVVLAVLASALWLTGCGTVEGLGKDITRGGQVISDAARDVHEQL